MAAISSAREHLHADHGGLETKQAVQIRHHAGQIEFFVPSGCLLHQPILPERQANRCTFSVIRALAPRIHPFSPEASFEDNGLPGQARQRRLEYRRHRQNALAQAQSPPLSQPEACS
jgi:hypothetical protein